MTRCSILNSRWSIPAAGLFAGLTPTAALAHASDRGFVLLLPTGHYIVGGALAVAASFAVLLWVPAGALARVMTWRLPLTRMPDERTVVSLLSFLLLGVLVAAGFLGSRDPLSNPLPLTIWTLFWIGLTLVTGLFGNVFAWVNPWRGPYRLVRGSHGQRAPSPMLHRLGYTPAILQFAAFAWFELIYPAPDDPARLAWAVSIYWTVNFAAMLVFGYDNWTRRGECFSVFFRIVSRLAVFERGDDGRLRFCAPSGKLVNAEPLSVSGVLFLLVALASVSFDGLMRTFAWLGAIGVNPLEFPGRSAVMVPNTLGLIGMAALLASAFFLAVWLGEKLSGEPVVVKEAAGLLIWSIAPIALAYHFAHYLIALLVNGQYALAAVSDPFSRGWNLFGTADNYISAGLVMGPQAAWVLWNLQSAAIVGGHVLAVVVAHGLAARLHATPRAAMLSQFPLTILMILYTVFGLWLLATPTGA
jgi:hypothetical protein